MSETHEFRKTGAVGTDTGAAAGDSIAAEPAFAALDPREQVKALLRDTVVGKPFNELFTVSLDHRAAASLGHLLLDALEDAGFAVGDFDAVGALTAAAVPMVAAVVQAAASRGEDVDGFVMDFVYPSIKGPSVKGRRVVLLDAWLSEKSYVQTSSLVTLRHGNELGLDFSVIGHEGGEVVAVAALVGGVGAEADANVIEVVNPVSDEVTDLPFVRVFDEAELR